MAKNITPLGIILFLFLSQLTFGQVQVKSTVKNQALIFRHDQDAIRGRLAEIQDESIVVLSSQREEKIPFADISRIILTFEQGSGRGPIYGGVLAGYTSTYILAGIQDHGGYLEKEGLALWLLLVVAPSVALGAGVGYLVDPGSSEKEEVFDFTGSYEEKNREKSRLARSVTHESRESKVHITFQGSHVYSNLPELTSPGSTSGDYYSYGYSRYKLTEFNWMRKMQATYSVLPEAEAGVALVWFNEPPKSSYSYEYPSGGIFKNYNEVQSFEASGKFIVALYNPLYRILDSRFNLKIGCGLGTASIDYKRTTFVSTRIDTPSSYTEQRSSFNFEENVVAGYLFGQFEFEVADDLSIGLVADKVFGPARTLPAVPEVNIPEQKSPFDNSSVGFTISLHF